MIAFAIEAVIRCLALSALVWAVISFVRPNPYLERTVWITVALGSLALPLLMKSGVLPVMHVSPWLSLRRVLAESAVKRWADPMMVLYALIACALVLRFAIGLVRFWFIRRRAEGLSGLLSGNSDVRVSPEISSPATFASTILLPVECMRWPSLKLMAVLAHERSHAERKDCYVQWLAHLHACLFWINPLAWWMRHRLAVLAENSSDDAAVAELGSRLEYAKVLLEIASCRSTSSVMLAAGRSNLPARIERLTSKLPATVKPLRRYQVLTMTLLLPILIAAAAPCYGPCPPCP